MNKEEKIAEFVGIMLGDGCIGIYGLEHNGRMKKQHQLKVTLDSRNQEYVKYVSNILSEVLGTTPKIHNKKTENATDLRIFKREKIRYVIEKIGLKLSPKWGRMEIPPHYSKGKLARFVIKGLFDTDGCVTIFNNNSTIYPRLEIRMSPSPAQKQIEEILLENGFNFKIQQLERGKTKIRISGRRELKKWFDLVGSSNPVHLNKALRFVK